MLPLTSMFFRLKQDVQAFFDMGWIILLPEQAEVEKYFRHEKPDFDGERTNNVRCKYTLILSKDMNGFPLTRLKLPVPQGKSKKENIISYPFSASESVHPCFAICHAGRFLKTSG